MPLSLRESLRRVARTRYAEPKLAGAALPREYVTHDHYEPKRDNPPAPVRDGAEAHKQVRSVGYPT